jgi:hypothetical protein
MKRSEVPRRSSATRPMRVMSRRLSTTYGLSVISTPIRENLDPGGPMT